MSSEITFVIFSLHWDKNSGGLIALHKLAHDLTSLGEKVYLHGSSKNPNYLGELYKGQEIKLDRAVYIYPEIVHGNPLGGKHVVRWLLNGVGVLGGDAGSWGPDDMVFKYCDFFGAPEPWKILGELRTLDAEVDFWAENLGRQRSGQCYTIRKGGHKPLNQHDPTAPCIDHYHDNEAIRNIFAQKQAFVSYDEATFLSVQAAMAGCLSIVVPQEGISAKEWRSKFPQHKYGLSYGFTKEELNHAKLTRHLVADHIRGMEKDSINTVKKFVKICKERVNG